ncbi:MAG TPA: response regulator [Candidatus Methylacidiphilales bacterium]|nr:response regulator [Candidatus Methylacidiphilales bacterium]
MKLLPKNVLAIDDSLTLRKFIEKSLAHEDCVNRLLLAPDAKTGIELAKAGNPDLILCDYTLPDMQGDDLCKLFAEDHETAHIPIILMSSSGREIGALALNQSNIVRLLVKPFSHELLVATISYVLSHWEQRKNVEEAVESSGSIVMRGSTDASPMCSTLRFIARQEMTGILRVTVRKDILHAFCQKGIIRVVSTRNVESYLEGTPYLTRGRKSLIWRKCEDLQRQTLSPFLLNLSQQGVLPAQTAKTLTDLYGHRLFAQIWTEPSVNYEFEQTRLPSFVEECAPSRERINDWILESLRNVNAADDIQSIAEDPLGVPVFTPSGYRQLQEVKAQQDEWQVLTQINGGTSLTEICRRLQAHPNLVARKIFCFQRLGFLDYWPSEVLQAQN